MTTLPAPFVNCARTVVTTAPSPPTTGTTLVISKITLPTIGPADFNARPFPETFRATIAPPLQPPTQANSEIVEVTKVDEEADKEHLKLTIVRQVEGPMTARLIQPGDVFTVSITASAVSPGPWVNCALGAKMVETKENAPVSLPQVRWLPWGLIQIRGHVESNQEVEIVKNVDTVLILPEAFVPGAANTEWNVQIPMIVKAWKDEAGTTQNTAIVTTIKPVAIGSREYASRATLPGGRVDTIFFGIFGPYQ